MDQAPSHIATVPPDMILQLVMSLVNAGCTFSAAPSPTVAGVWHVGLEPAGIDVLTSTFGPAVNINIPGPK